MSPDTAATTRTQTRPRTPASGPPATAPGPGGRGGSKRFWTYLTISAAAAFAGALALAATGLFTQTPPEVADTPERSVEAFLAALLDDRDAAEASQWLCEAKAERDLTDATAALAAAGEERDVDFSAVAETERTVGESTVTAELSTGGETVTWTFSLVAEEGEPQWQVCGIARR